MPGGVADDTGARIAQYRKLRGLTQRGLALRASVAYGTLTKVESGHATPQPSVVAAVARALGVDVGQLVGRPRPRCADDEPLVEAELIDPLREALDAYDLDPDEAVAPRPFCEVEADVYARARELLRDGWIGAVAAALPGLLDELGALAAAPAAPAAPDAPAADGPGDTRIWRAMAQAYRGAHHVAWRLGYRDLAVLALDRMGRAVERTGDPLLEALHQYERGHEHLRAGQHHRGHTLLGRAERIARAAPPGPGRAALFGTGYLAASVHAARDGDGEAAEDYLGAAQALADEVGEIGSTFWLGFGPTNLALHRVSVLVAQERYAEAVAQAGQVEVPSGGHPTRLAHHHMDLGRAHAALRDHDRALRCLAEARRVAPEQVRTHPMTLVTVEQLLASRRNVSEALARYARWVGV
jgi:transcriptional regulator with XRE-family HTH domain